MEKNLTFRFEVREKDIQRVRELAESSGFFYPDEVDVAVELVEERLAKGDASGYFFIFAEIDEITAGYTCFGPIPCTKTSFDLYWIVTHNDFRGKGIGKQLLALTSQVIREMKGHKLYAETSSRQQYLPTQKFYEKNDFEKEAQIKDFYDSGDDKIIYGRKV
jgi:Acetyltransferases